MILDTHTLAYLANVHNAMTGAVDIPPVQSCPECGDEAIGLRFSYDHIVIEVSPRVFSIVIACEGYWAINPNLVGIHAPDWSDINGDIPVLNSSVAPDHDQLLMSAIMDRPNGDILNIVQAASELDGTTYDRLSKAYDEVTTA